ncbi:MAG TPA: hypothetical protein VEO36_00630 [Casimicrobiaceae bacterium]|nr:hypothetical protein [Casimicrobiaceae bacterium]
MKLRPTIRISGIGLSLAALALGPAAFAEEIRISGSDCAPVVRLVARDARLSDVLKRLAQMLDFQLSFESENDPLVSINANREPSELVGVLAPSENISLAQARNPRCPNRERIVKVWVLPKGQRNIARIATTRQATAPNAPVEQARTAQNNGDSSASDADTATLQPDEQDPQNPH